MLLATLTQPCHRQVAILPSRLAGLGDSLLLDSSSHMPPWVISFQAPATSRVLSTCGLKFYHSWKAPTTLPSLSWLLENSTLLSWALPSQPLERKSISSYPLASGGGLVALGKKCRLIWAANGPSPPKSWFIFPEGEKAWPSEKQSWPPIPKEWRACLFWAAETNNVVLFAYSATLESQNFTQKAHISTSRK